MWFKLPVALLLIFSDTVKALDSLHSRIIPTALPIKLPIQAESRSLHARNIALSAGMSSVTLSSDRQSYYTILKTGVISFRVALDTASSDLWLMSTDCKTSSCAAVPKYPLAYESSTFASLNDNQTAFRVGYGDGTTASGFVARESVQFANMTVPDQAFGVVTDTNVTFLDNVSGVLGLGFSRLSSISSSAVNAKPFFSNLAQSGVLDYPLFAFSLTYSDSGTLSLGAIDSGIVKDVRNISWHPVVEFSPFGSENNVSSYLQWATPLAGIYVNDANITLTPTYPQATGGRSLALFDIGTSGIYGPMPDVAAIFSRFDGSRLVDDGGQWVVPCDSTQIITLQFGNTNLTLGPIDYLIGPAEGNPALCLTWPRALSPSSDGIDWQMGDAFLRTVYSIFSFGIDGKEAPLIGLYALNTNMSLQTTEAVQAHFSSLSATVATTLPNSLIPTPTYTTPSYVFNSSVPAPTGALVSSGLATSSYTPILATAVRNLTALPSMAMQGPKVVIQITDSSGAVSTSTSTLPAESPTLGLPPGWNAGLRLSCSSLSSLSMLILSSIGLISSLNII